MHVGLAVDPVVAEAGCAGVRADLDHPGVGEVIVQTVGDACEAEANLMGVGTVLVVTLGRRENRLDRNRVFWPGSV